MSTIKSALWVAIVAVLSMPVAVQAQHAGHEAQEATPRSAASPSDAQHQAHGQHDGHSEDDDAQHGDHSAMGHADHSQMDHSQHGASGQVDHSQHGASGQMDHSQHGTSNQVDHSQMDHSGHSSGDPNHGLREPIPPITDADRAAAFPELRHHHTHGASRHSFWLLDQFEVSDTSDGTEIGWEGIGWVGSDLNRLWLRSKGHALDGSVQRGRIEALYGRPVLRWWDVVAGVRQDFGNGPSRTWAAFGVQGLAPYFFEIEATAYVGESGRTALSVAAEYEMLLTNRLILTWETEANAFGKSDPEQVIGSGLSTVELGLRLRYEITRQFAPYIGFEREWSYGETADLRALTSHGRTDNRWVVGLRLWF
jgi:copper resistance protein B